MKMAFHIEEYFASIGVSGLRVVSSEAVDSKAEHDHLRLPLDHELYTWANDQQTAKRNH
jgi:hypothetical protein